MKKMVREDNVLRFIDDEPKVPSSTFVHLLQSVVATPDEQLANNADLMARAIKALAILSFREYGIMYDWKP